MHRRSRNFQTLTAPKSISANVVTGHIEQMIWSHSYREGAAIARNNPSLANIHGEIAAEFISFGYWNNLQGEEMFKLRDDGKRAGKVQTENQLRVEEERAARGL